MRGGSRSTGTGPTRAGCEPGRYPGGMAQEQVPEPFDDVRDPRSGYISCDALQGEPSPRKADRLSRAQRSQLARRVAVGLAIAAVPLSSVLIYWLLALSSFPDVHAFRFAAIPSIVGCAVIVRRLIHGSLP